MSPRQITGVLRGVEIVVKGRWLRGTVFPLNELKHSEKCSCRSNQYQRKGVILVTRVRAAAHDANDTYQG